MPSPAEADSLRNLLLILLGVMILTIPVVCLIVVSKVMAQRRNTPKTNISGSGPDPTDDRRGIRDTVLPLTAAAMVAPHFPSHEPEPDHFPAESPPVEPEVISDSGASRSSWDDAGGVGDGGFSSSGGDGGGGDGGGGDGGGSSD